MAGCFDGFNATVIAYGQTGAGKTHTMGTGFEMDVLEHQEGMIPRALRQIFNGIKSREGKFFFLIFLFNFLKDFFV